MNANMINTITPKGFTLVNNKALVNPSNTGVIGALHINNATGVYVLLSAGTVCSCPQKWARENDTTIAR